MDIFKERILPLFQSTELRAAELERQIGIKPKKINDWSSGRTKSYEKYIPQIAAYFHVSTDYLLGKTDDPTPPGAEKNPATPKGSGPIDWNKLLDGLSQDALVRLQNEIVRRIAEGGEKHE